MLRARERVSGLSQWAAAETRDKTLGNFLLCRAMFSYENVITSKYLTHSSTHVRNKPFQHEQAKIY